MGQDGGAGGGGFTDIQKRQQEELLNAREQTGFEGRLSACLLIITSMLTLRGAANKDSFFVCVFFRPQDCSKIVQPFAVGLLRHWGSQKHLLFNFTGNRAVHVGQNEHICI